MNCSVFNKLFDKAATFSVASCSSELVKLTQKSAWRANSQFCLTPLTSDDEAGKSWVSLRGSSLDIKGLLEINFNLASKILFRHNGPTLLRKSQAMYFPPQYLPACHVFMLFLLCFVLFLALFCLIFLVLLFTFSYFQTRGETCFIVWK